jgi:hypothetical protein
MDAGIRVCLDKHHEACEALMEHFYGRNDDKGLELFDEVIEYAFMALKVSCDAWRTQNEALRARITNGKH